MLCVQGGERERVPVFKFCCVIESAEVRRGELQEALSICTRRHEEIGSLLHPRHLTLLGNSVASGMAPASQGRLAVLGMFI